MLKFFRHMSSLAYLLFIKHKKKTPPCEVQESESQKVYQTYFWNGRNFCFLPGVSANSCRPIFGFIPIIIFNPGPRSVLIIPKPDIKEFGGRFRYLKPPFGVTVPGGAWSQKIFAQESPQIHADQFFFFIYPLVH